MIDKARFLIKSFDNVQYAKKFLMEGEMYFNCPAYFRYLAKRGELAKLNNNGEAIKNQFKGIGDFNEASIAWTIRVYQNIPIYCMYRGILRRIGDISAFSKIISYEVLNCFDEKYYSFNIK